MNQTEFERVAASFAAFHEQFAPLFGRKEAQRRSEQYLRGLLVQQTDRRNAENVAETIAGATPRSLQRLLTEAPWSTEPLIDRLQAYLAPRLNHPLGVFVLDESGFPKQGTKSVGVGRQYCATMGKVGNCQVGVFLAYVSPLGHALVDKRLYLPPAWTDDPLRCQGAGVPAEIVEIGYQSKTDLGLSMLRAARGRGTGHLQGEWVAGDDAYGVVPTLRDALDAEGWYYVLDVPQTTPVFTQAATIAIPPWSGRGRKPTIPRLAQDAPPPRSVQVVADSLPPTQWQELTVAEGAQGPRTYRFVALRVWESRDGLPGRGCWLLLRRNLDGTEPRYYLSNAPPDTPLLLMAQVAAARWAIETEFEIAKGETGLDEYEVRSWAGWHHHITLAMLAGAFLLSMQQEWGEKDAPTNPPTSEPSASRTATPSELDTGRTAPMVGGDAASQRASQTLTHQTASHQAPSTP